MKAGKDGCEDEKDGGGNEVKPKGHSELQDQDNSANLRMDNPKKEIKIINYYFI
jgi:hypothetical protein